MKENPNDVTVSAAVHQDMADRLKQIAKQKGMTQSQVIRAFLASGLERYERILKGRLS